MSDKPAVIVEPNRFQWWFLTSLVLGLIAVFFHPLSLAISLILHWVWGQHKFFKGAAWGGGIVSALWYGYYHPVFFTDPGQPPQTFIMTIPLITGMLQPMGGIRMILRPRSLAEQVAEERDEIEAEAHRRRQEAGVIERKPLQREPDKIRLGIHLSGDDFSRTIGLSKQSRWIVAESDTFKEHAFILGATGSGKTETIKRLIYESAINTDGKIFLVDGKGEDGLAHFVRAI